MLKAMAGALFLMGSFTVTPTLAANPADYGGGSCRAMVQNNDPASLWVGRFVGMKDHSAAHDVACFTDHNECLTWVSKTSDQVGIKRIVQLSCHLHG